MVKQCLLSIITPMYNLGEYIENTLKSLTCQNLSRTEILLIDDGSKDDTVYIAEKFLSQYPEIEYKIIRKSNGGVSSARNRGITESKGEYIFFLDGDDYVSEDFIETIYKNIENNSPDILCWGYDTITIDHKVVVSYFSKFSLNSHSYFMTGFEAFQNIVDKKLWIWTCSAAYNRGFILRNNMSYTEGCSNGEDTEFTFKALLKANKVLFINKIMSYYVYREGSISNRYDIKRFDAIGAIKRTYQHMIKANNTNIGKVVKEFRNEMIIQNYFLNLHSCFKHSKTYDIHEILAEIDKFYPNLNKEIIELMKEYEGKNLKEVLRIKLFLVSPQLYFNLIKLKYKVKRLVYDE